MLLQDHAEASRSHATRKKIIFSSRFSGKYGPNDNDQHWSSPSSTSFINSTLAVFEICLIKSDTLHVLMSQQPGEDNLYYFSETVNFNVPVHRSKISIRKTLNKYLIENFLIQQHRHLERKHFEYPNGSWTCNPLGQVVQSRVKKTHNQCEIWIQI